MLDSFWRYLWMINVFLLWKQGEHVYNQQIFLGEKVSSHFEFHFYSCEVDKPCGEFMTSRRNSHRFRDWGIWRAFGNSFGNDMMVTAMFLYYVRQDTRLQYLKTIHAYLVLVVICFLQRFIQQWGSCFNCFLQRLWESKSMFHFLQHVCCWFHRIQNHWSQVSNLRHAPSPKACIFFHCRFVFNLLP